MLKSVFNVIFFSNFNLLYENTLEKVYNTIAFYLIHFYRLFHYTKPFIFQYEQFSIGFFPLIFGSQFEKLLLGKYIQWMFTSFGRFFLCFQGCSFILHDDDKMLKIVWIALKWHEVGEQDVAGCSCCIHFFLLLLLHISTKNITDFR